MLNEWHWTQVGQCDACLGLFEDLKDLRLAECGYSHDGLRGDLVGAFFIFDRPDFGGAIRLGAARNRSESPVCPKRIL
jgi:hypothetical protein